MQLVMVFCSSRDTDGWQNPYIYVQSTNVTETVTLDQQSQVGSVQKKRMGS